MPRALPVTLWKAQPSHGQNAAPATLRRCRSSYARGQTCLLGMRQIFGSEEPLASRQRHLAACLSEPVTPQGLPAFGHALGCALSHVTEEAKQVPWKRRWQETGWWSRNLPCSLLPSTAEAGNRFGAIQALGHTRGWMQQKPDPCFK